MTHTLTNESIIFNISCCVVLVFTLNLVPKRFKYVTVKCVCKRYPPLFTSTLIGSSFRTSCNEQWEQYTVYCTQMFLWFQGQTVNMIYLLLKLNYLAINMKMWFQIKSFELGVCIMDMYRICINILNIILQVHISC